MGKLDHLEERLSAIEGGRDYAFTDVEELFLVPKCGHCFEVHAIIFYLF